MLYPSQDTVKATIVVQDSTPRFRKFNEAEVDSIFKMLERREEMLDSIARAGVRMRYFQSLKPPEPEGFDTAAVPYYLTDDSVPFLIHPISHFSTRYFCSRDTTKPVLVEVADNPPFKQETLSESRSPSDSPAVRSHDLRPDWLLGIIIASLVLLAWLKLFYHKFLDQMMQSVTNYQLSVKLLRDQNIFSKRVAIALNLNFVFIGGAFVYLIFGYFNLRPFLLNDILSYLCYSGCLMVLLLVRHVVLHVTGYLFDSHHVFREYLHQIFLIYKSLGIYIIILVIGLAYIREDLRIYFVYLGILLVFTAYFLRLFKGVKILLNKDVLIFYLILYLCTLEILPFLILYRFFSLSVLRG
ncbi:MAG: hypothetical protein AMS26_00350 [Bacteroides sp. SM23_62]|nr:MAG: hypothetical protein AMS26_00350 [Bacteroides sp. SM23_62]